MLESQAVLTSSTYAQQRSEEENSIRAKLIKANIKSNNSKANKMANIESSASLEQQQLFMQEHERKHKIHIGMRTATNVRLHTNTHKCVHTYAQMYTCTHS